MENIRLSVSDFIALTNQTLDYAFNLLEIEGEVASFSVNQNKYVFFDLKDQTGTVNCFMMLWQLHQPIENGMQVTVLAAPKLTNKGRFSLTIQKISPRGEGAIKKSFDLLRAKLEREGLFAPENKRPLPSFVQTIGVISSPQAAGYADFIKIINQQSLGLQIKVAPVKVQGSGASQQITKAIEYFNQHLGEVEVLVLLRGGGSADDLSIFNDEPLVRAIAASRIPIITGIGHEVDQTLADFAADFRAATPSHAAQIIVPSAAQTKTQIQQKITAMAHILEESVHQKQRLIAQGLRLALDKTSQQYAATREYLLSLERLIEQLDPERILARGYAILRGKITTGALISIETKSTIIKAEVKSYESKNRYN